MANETIGDVRDEFKSVDPANTPHLNNPAEVTALNPLDPNSEFWKEYRESGKRFDKLKIAAVAGFIAVLGAVNVPVMGDAFFGQHWFMKTDKPPPPPKEIVYQPPQQPLQKLFLEEGSKIGHERVIIHVAGSEGQDSKRILIPAGNIEGNVPIKVPEQLRAAAQEQVDAVNTVIQPKNRIEKINILNGQLAGYGDGRNAIELDVPAGDRVSPDYMARTAFHESIHIFQSQFDENYGAGYENDFLQLHQEQRAVQNLITHIMQQEHYSAGQTDLMANDEGYADANHDEYLGTLFKALDESSYSGYSGHPSDNSSELMASTLTVLRFYPESFMQTVQHMDAKDHAILIKVGRDSVNILYKHSPDKQAVTNLFSPQLLNYLGVNSSN